MTLKNKKGFTMIEVIISFVCLSFLLLSIMYFVGGQSRFSENLIQNNKSYNEVVSLAETGGYNSAADVKNVDISIKIGVKTFNYNLKEMEYSDINSRYHLYKLKVR